MTLSQEHLPIFLMFDVKQDTSFVNDTSKLVVLTLFGQGCNDTNNQRLDPCSVYPQSRKGILPVEDSGACRMVKQKESKGETYLIPKYGINGLTVRSKMSVSLQLAHWMDFLGDYYLKIMFSKF